MDHLDVIAKQPIVSYPGQSRRMQDGKPITKLLKQYPGEWQDGFLPLPYRMIIKVKAKDELVLTKDHLKEVRKIILRLVRKLPVKFREPYNYILKVLKRKDAIDEFDVPRAIEYLTIVSSRFILDKIRQQLGSEKEVEFQGVVLKSRHDVRKKMVSTDLWLLHGLGPSVDPLVMTALNLASEKVMSVLSGVEMDLPVILMRKVPRFTPESAKTEKVTSTSDSFVKRIFRILGGQILSLFGL